ncbi:Uncharacterised protein [Mycobacteroides abscessus subsp. massiliense]|nr:Uncharacterised protein [Mycobacteroides abscessus subsp. massiliense]SKO11354.1 Uncharacterised protein [Mycobacteroides abscessus subsp. massiliense]
MIHWFDHVSAVVAAVVWLAGAAAELGYLRWGRGHFEGECLLDIEGLCFSSLGRGECDDAFPEAFGDRTIRYRVIVAFGPLEQTVESVLERPRQACAFLELSCTIVLPSLKFLCRVLDGGVLLLGGFAGLAFPTVAVQILGAVELIDSLLCPPNRAPGHLCVVLALG